MGRPVLDLTNDRYGKLVALELLTMRKPHKWKCVCDCGSYHIARTGDLRAGKVKSCGCLYLDLRKPNVITKHGDIAKIHINNKPIAALIDSDMIQKVQGYTWVFSGGKKYVVGQSRGVLKLLHRLIMLPGPGQHVDHISGDTLDNRRINLRLCTPAENSRNHSKLNKNNSSGYRGVSFIRGKWQTTIMFEGKSKYLGRYHSLEEAAKAYDRAAKEFFGEFATLNFE